MTEPVVTDPASDAGNDPGDPGGPDPRAALQVLARVLGGGLAVLLRILRVLGRGLSALGRFLRRWRAPLVLIPLIAGLGYAALLGGRMLWADIPDASSSARDVVCWDGSEAPRADCALPSGAKGLHWVFPSFRPNGGRCEQAVFTDAGRDRPLQFDCTQRVKGAQVTVSYSQRSTLKRGQSYFSHRYPGVATTKQAGGERLLYRDAAPRGDGTFEATVSYVRYPFAVTVNAATPELVDAALDSLVSYRPASFVTVRPPA
ncbi:hypothetical protein BH11ACT8_BH11ACT8_32610 [soil metagenome]